MRMKRINGAGIVRLTAVALCAVLLFTSLPGGGMITTEAETTSATISKLQDQLKRNEQDQAALKAQISDAESDIDSMLDTKAYLDGQLNLKEQKIAITEELIEQYKIEIQNMKDELAQKESNLGKEYDTFRTQLRISYEDKDTNYFELLFSSESLLDFLVNAERTAILLEYEKEYLSDLNAQAEDLNELKKKLENERADQESYIAQLELDKADLEQSTYEAQQYIKTRERELKQNQTEYDKLIQANAELDAKLEKQLKELAARSQQTYVGGIFMWPLDIGFRGISSGFGWRDLNGKEFHKALDIPANYGSNIYAANGGTVVIAT